MMALREEPPYLYMPYEGPSLANQNSRKLEVYDRKLDGNHPTILLSFC